MTAKSDVTADTQLLRYAQAWARDAGNVSKILALPTGSDEQTEEVLFALLAGRASDPNQNFGTPGDRFNTTYDPGSLVRGPSIGELGRRIFLRCARQLHSFLCDPTEEDKELRMRVKEALVSSDPKSTALVAGCMVAAFGTAPAVATIVAALAWHFVGAPTVDEVCLSFDEDMRKKLGLPGAGA